MKKNFSIFTISLMLALLIAGGQAQAATEQGAKADGNILTMAVAWKQTEAEYRALYHQGFNLATQKVKDALQNRKSGGKPLAVLTDLDDTLLLPLNYWGALIDRGQDFFDDALWDGWIAKYEMIPSPGALEFLNYCKENGVEVYYVTNRDQGKDTYDLALESLKRLGFPYADKDHLTVLIETSNKEDAQKAVAEKFDVVCYLGDSLNDFKRVYYVKDVDERIALMENDRALFGDKFIIFPNPTDGHWIRAIFGDSEPPASDENRQKFKEAAMKNKTKP
jgi:5'-nucleotidase (lipoprotein e(P4) family)